MNKHGKELFQIGEVARIMGITRKAILVYEDMGLLTPAVKDEVLTSPLRRERCTHWLVGMVQVRLH